MSDNLLLNDSIIQSLYVSIVQGDANLSDVPGLLRRVINEQMWRKRFIKRTGEVAEFDQFIDFIETPPLEGLGTTVDTLRRLVVHDTEVAVILDRTLKELIPPIAKHGGDRKSNQGSVTTLNEEDRGAEYALRRLKRDRPDLAERVVNGNLSANAAAVEAGFRPRRIALRLDNMRAIAEKLAKKLDAEQIDQLIALLQEFRG